MDDHELLVASALLVLHLATILARAFPRITPKIAAPPPALVDQSRSDSVIDVHH
jgi:hypothetical protein